MKVTIISLGKYPDIFDYFRQRLDEKVDPSIRKILVRDGNEIQSAPDQGRQSLEAVEQFKRKHGHWDVVGEWKW
jgi:hypothetical protein